MDSSLPPFRGQFEDGPRDPSLPVELLVLERRSNSEHPMVVTGALVRPPDGPATWVEGLEDDEYVSAGTDPETLWAYLTDKGGGNGVTFDVAFLWVRDVGDVIRVARYVGECLREEHQAMIELRSRHRFSGK